jgi:drug/metabolite transporter (DMT)-like permease
MKDLSRLHLKTDFLILVIVILAPLGNVLFSKGMKGVESAANWAPGNSWHILIRILSSGYIWLGIASMLTFFVAYMVLLSWADYSYVQPSAAFSYFVVAVLSYLLLGEVVPPLRWLGIGIICVGVLVVKRTHPRTTESA